MLSKWIIYAVVVLIYTLLTVHVTRVYTNASWLSKELARSEVFIQTQKENNDLRQDISRMLQDNLALSATRNKQFTKELLDEIAKDPRYKSCRTTDGVRNALQRKLDAQ